MFLLKNKKTQNYVTKNFCTMTVSLTFIECLYESESCLLSQAQVDQFFLTHDKDDYEVMYKH